MNSASIAAAFVAGAALTVFAVVLLSSRRRRRFDGHWSDEQIESLYVAEPRQLVRAAGSSEG